jgi:hypothetical protein
MKRKNIIKLNSIYGYQVKINSTSRRLQLLDLEGNYEAYFKKSDILKLNAKSIEIPYYWDDVFDNGNKSVYNIHKCEDCYRIGCCNVTVKDMNYIKSRFKKMK